MGIKLKLLFLSFIFFNCSTVKDKESKNKWINTYKTVAFRGCITESYQNDTILKLISKYDYLVQPEILANWGAYDQANELGVISAQSIKPPIHPKLEEADKSFLLKKNYFLQNCLLFYQSKELNLKANNAYKKNIIQLDSLKVK